jgi:hypothetical protein
VPIAIPEQESKKSENQFMDVEDVRSNIYSSLNDLNSPRRTELTPKSHRIKAGFAELTNLEPHNLKMNTPNGMLEKK